MKICFLIKSLGAGGAERSTVSLADFFAECGHEVSILTFDITECFYPLCDKVNIISADLSDIALSASAKRIFGAVKRMLRLRNAVKKIHPDVLIGMSFAMTWYAVLTTAFTGIKSVGTERSNPYKYKATRVNTFLRKFFYRFTDGYVFQTAKAAGFFTKKLRNTDAILPNAIYNEAVCELKPPAEREKVICSVGRLCLTKRFDLLMEAFDEIADKIPEHKLIIYGGGELADELQKKADSLKAHDRIILAGATPDAVKFVNKAQIFVLSSELEGMPNALMEALAMGVPCVSTRCEIGPEELIEDGVNGLLVEVNNTRQMASAMLKLINSPDLSKSLGEKSAQLKQTNSIEAISRQWLELLGKII